MFDILIKLIHQYFGDEIKKTPVDEFINSYIDAINVFEGNFESFRKTYRFSFLADLDYNVFKDWKNIPQEIQIMSLISAKRCWDIHQDN